MKKFIFLFFIFPTLIFSQSQRKKQIQLKNDTIYTMLFGKDFHSKEYSATDKVEEGKIYHSKKEGNWISYFNDGKIKLIAEYKNGIPCGNFQKFYENGKIREKGKFVNYHYIDTLFRYYQNGNIESMTVFNEKGEENGENKYFHDNGKVAFVYERESNKIENLITWYNEDGNLKHQLECSKNGKIKPLIENESSFAIDNSIEKKKVFSLRIADPITKDVPFNPNGFNIIYTKHDEVYQIGEFSNGSLIDGKSYQYDDDGLLNKILVYKTGKFVSYAQLKKNK
jgi:antitoxin component YwqK of YwqJK toxin-antitoxin module